MVSEGSSRLQSKERLEVLTSLQVKVWMSKEIAGSVTGGEGAHAKLKAMLAAGTNRHLNALGVRGLSEEVMYDKCLEFLGCFPEKVKFEEAVVCGAIVAALAVGGFLVWKSRAVDANQVAPAPPAKGKGQGGKGTPGGAPAQQKKHVRKAFRNLALS